MRRRQVLGRAVLDGPSGQALADAERRRHDLVGPHVDRVQGHDQPAHLVHPVDREGVVADEPPQLARDPLEQLLEARRAQQHPRDVDQRLVRPQPRGLGIAFGRLSVRAKKGAPQSGECASSHGGGCTVNLPLPGRGIPARQPSTLGPIARRDEGAASPDARHRRHPHPPGARPRVDARRRPRGANADHGRADRPPRDRRRAADVDAAVATGHGGVRGVARRCPRRAAASSSACSARSCGARRTRSARSSPSRPGKIVPGGPRRGAGDDRHLRLRASVCRASSTGSRSRPSGRATACSRPGTRSGRSP